MIRKCHYYMLQFNAWHIYKETKYTNSHVTSRGNQNKAAVSSLFPSDMIGKLEMMLRTTQKNNGQSQNPNKTMIAAVNN